MKKPVFVIDISGFCGVPVNVGSSGFPSPSGSSSVGLLGSSDVSVTGSPLGSIPVTIEELTTPPLSMSACVIVNVPVNVVLSLAPGAKLASGPPTTVTKGSVIVIFVRVLPPVFVTVNVYVIVSPA